MILTRAIYVAALLVLSGCQTWPQARLVDHQQAAMAVAELTISLEGVYHLQGKEVPSAHLQHELGLLQPSPGSVHLRITADPMGTYAAVNFALYAARQAGIGSMGFVTPEASK